MNLSFYKGRKVFITGHTGFKGAWMCKLLINHGASVIGYSLAPMTQPNLFELAELDKKMISIIADIRNLDSLKKAMIYHQPEIAIHMAAQPLVRDSYDDPVYTYDVNVMGTVNFLEAVRHCSSIKSVINVTTDKVYLNNEWEWGYRETDRLDGYDPYSNSKSCSELITSTYIKSFFFDKNIPISTCRAGNVIGGGDFSKDRIIPDCVDAMKNKREIIVRNPYSTRPYQHVLEPVYTYLMLAEKQYDDHSIAGAYNVGPEDEDCVTTGALVDLFCSKWGQGASWRNVAPKNPPHEANFLKLDCSKIKKNLDWKAKWHIADAIDKTAEWSKAYIDNGNINAIMDHQIKIFLA